MPFLTKGKTNWKYILIVLILAVIVGGGILGYLRYLNKEISSLSKFPEIKKREKITEGGKEIFTIEIVDMLKLIAKKHGFQYEKLTYKIEDLDGNAFPEILVYYNDVERAEFFYLTIFAPIDKEGKKYRQKGEGIFQYYSLYGFYSFQDITGDNRKEIILNLGPAANMAVTIYGILDWDGEKIDWIKLKEKDGTIEPAILRSGPGLSYFDDFEFNDLNKNGKPEIIIIHKQYEPLEGAPGKRKTTTITSVYEWDGTVFTYSEELSKVETEIEVEGVGFSTQKQKLSSGG
jgi:hypothetical protein